jgi:hypothetical protein
VIIFQKILHHQFTGNFMVIFVPLKRKLKFFSVQTFPATKKNFFVRNFETKMNFFVWKFREKRELPVELLLEQKTYKIFSPFIISVMVRPWRHSQICRC